jgi:CubicO group peptidase (beta-lactamase class C family)
MAPALLLAFSLCQCIVPICVHSAFQDDETPGRHARRLNTVSSGDSGFRTAGLDSVRALMEQAVRDSVFPGAVLLVGRRDIVILHEAFGKLGYPPFDQPMPPDAIFDMASLTKVVATTTACMLLYEKDLLDLNTPVQKYFSDFAGGGKEQITIKHLLTHSSGLPAYKKYFLEDKTPAEILAAILQEELVYAPGSQTSYSDLGIILLGKILERMTQRQLEEFCRDEIFVPLGMHHTRYNPPAQWRDRIPPTEQETWPGGHRGKFVHGVVHDENAYALGGVSAHAGLFSTADDLAGFMQMLLHGGSRGPAHLLELETIGWFTQRQELPPGSSRALGWDTPDGKNSAGTLMSASAFGHTGFTGTSLWADPAQDLFVILLSNRVHPTRENKRILSFRPQLHDAVVRALDTSNAQSTK